MFQVSHALEGRGGLPSGDGRQLEEDSTPSERMDAYAEVCFKTGKGGVETRRYWPAGVMSC
jgi:hypothetical protein